MMDYDERILVRVAIVTIAKVIDEKEVCLGFLIFTTSFSVL